MVTEKSLKTRLQYTKNFSKPRCKEVVDFCRAHEMNVFDDFLNGGVLPADHLADWTGDKALAYIAFLTREREGRQWFSKEQTNSEFVDAVLDVSEGRYLTFVADGFVQVFEVVDGENKIVEPLAQDEPHLQ